MKRLFLSITAATCFILLFSVNALAGWVVSFPDVTVNPHSTVEYSVYGEWDEPLLTIIVPTVVREITPGSFWTGTLPVDTVGGVAAGVQWSWANPSWPILIQELRPGVPEAGACDAEGDVGYDGTSSDHFVVAVAGIVSENPAPTGRVFLTITFDVTGTPGDFEFDTACFLRSLNTIYLIDDAFPPVNHGANGTGELVFNKGVVTIGSVCDCSSSGDLNDDGMLNSVDVVYFINYAFMHGPEPASDKSCPMINRADWDCSEAINLVDIVKMINYIYRNLPPGPCDPCGP